MRIQKNTEHTANSLTARTLSPKTKPLLVGRELTLLLLSFRLGTSEAAAFDSDESEAMGATRVQIALK